MSGQIRVEEQATRSTPEALLTPAEGLGHFQGTVEVKVPEMKTNRLNKTLAQQYRNRWQQVAQIERQEQQAASYQQRWIQLNNLWRLAAGLTLLSAPNETVVWQRWARLKEGLE